MNIEIINEAPDHFDQVDKLLREAFPGDEEARLVRQLRADGDAAISLVALDGDRVVGQVMFSPMEAPFKALGLAPVSVSETHRRQGVADRLIREGLAAAKGQRVEGVFVLGDPDYYGRFGFDVAAAAPFESPYAGPYFALSWLTDREAPSSGGRVDYAPAFAGLE